MDVKELKTLVKFSGAGGGVSISFEQKHLGERIRYDIDKESADYSGGAAELKGSVATVLKRLFQL